MIYASDLNRDLKKHTEIILFRRISFGYVAFMTSLGGMAVLVALTKFGVVGHDFGLYFTVVATIFTGIGCGGKSLQL